MSAALRGRLVTASFARDLLELLAGASAPPAAIVTALDAGYARAEAALGPASSVRSVTDLSVIPLLRLLGYSVRTRVDEPQACALGLCAGAVPMPVAALVVAWAAPLHGHWRPAVLQGVATDARWVFCCNGVSVRVIDAQRTWSRDYLEFDLAQLSGDIVAQTTMWSLLRTDAMRVAPTRLEVAAERAVKQGVSVCRALGSGVIESLQLLTATRPRRDGLPAVRFEQSLTVLYRVLFLLFAEARGLVPIWHPVYRDRYTLDTIVSALLTTGRYRGIWHAVQAISRLAHAGLAAPGLRITAFNGRLFAPGRAGEFDRRPVPDAVMSRVVLAVGSTARRSGARARIAYRDLDVEQLGAVYEQVLEYQPLDSARDTPLDPARSRPALQQTRELRKATGSFYTPRALTAALVRQTLDPLVRGASSDGILSLRILDPAMGSGAFLVGACRYLAAAAEDALIREGRWHAHDVTAADRAGLRRTIATRCLYGVDLNPMAVQLARLSLWLVTLAADKPLSFFDHHLIAGDSLVGAAPSDLRRQPSRGHGRGNRHTAMPLFDDAGVDAIVDAAAQARSALAASPDDTAADVHAKERHLEAIDARDTALGRWRQALDLWCAGWFLPAGTRLDRGTFLELIDHLLRGRSSLPPATVAALLRPVAAAAASRRFVHWSLAFPEVFAGAGFDAVIGNPPWDMVRGDGAGAEARRADARMLTGFVRETGIYRVDTRAHVNRYQLFVERALQLTRPGGRIGLVLPSGIVADVGAAPLRRYLFDRAAVDTVVGIDNREAIFPIHRSVRFVTLSATAGRRTESIRCRFGVTRATDLERPAAPLIITRRLLATISGADDLGIPELGSPDDLRIVERLTASHPALASAAGWHATFGRELNATDDRGAFEPAGGAPDARLVVEGKHIGPFRVSLDRCTQQVAPASSAARRVPRRVRLAYRDVASSGNRLTIIAAVIPARVVTTHTLFCLKTPLPHERQRVLCALLNSFVANYLIRLRVTMHVTVGLMSRLPVPIVDEGAAEAAALAALTRRLERGTAPCEPMPEYAEVQARAARLYGLTREEFAHVLGTFPLIAEQTRRAVFDRFSAGDGC